jgi:hypothetical protein
VALSGADTGSVLGLTDIRAVKGKVALEESGRMVIETGVRVNP